MLLATAIVFGVPVWPCTPLAAAARSNAQPEPVAPERACGPELVVPGRSEWGPYVVWYHLAEPLPVYPNRFGLVRVMRGSRTVLRIHDWSITHLQQMDLTGDGIPELVIQQFSGGAHCCFTLSVFARTPTVRTLVRWYQRNYGEQCHFRDLDADGRLEIAGLYDGFAYYDYSYAVSPALPMVLRYDGRRFVDATRHYPHLIRKELEKVRSDLIRGRTREEKTDWWQQRSRSLLPALYVDAVLLGTQQQEYAWVQAHRPAEEVAWLKAHCSGIERILRKRSERLSYPTPSQIKRAYD